MVHGEQKVRVDRVLTLVFFFFLATLDITCYGLTSLKGSELDSLRPVTWLLVKLSPREETWGTSVHVLEM